MVGSSIVDSTSGTILQVRYMFTLVFGYNCIVEEDRHCPINVLENMIGFMIV
jgi:hypothetical protein